MTIEREYKLELEDYVNFQQHQFRINAKKNSWRNLLQILLIFLPIFYILFSVIFTVDHNIKTIGLIVTICFVVYYFIVGIFSERVNKNYFKKVHYNNKEFSINVKIIITENTIEEYCQNSESKILKQWIHEYQENKNYIYLMSIYKAGVLLPKKYFSREEIENIRKYFQN